MAQMVTIPKAELDALYTRLAGAEAYVANDRRRSREWHERKKGVPRPVAQSEVRRPDPDARPVAQSEVRRPEAVTLAERRPVAQTAIRRPASRARVLNSPGRDSVRNLEPGGGGALRARGAPPPPGHMPARQTTLDALWTHPRIRAVIDKRGLNADWERANFARKHRHADLLRLTVEDLETWLARSFVQIQDPSPLVAAVGDRRSAASAHTTGVAEGAYSHAGRVDGIDPRELERFYGTAAT